MFWIHGVLPLIHQTLHQSLSTKFDFRGTLGISVSRKAVLPNAILVTTRMIIHALVAKTVRTSILTWHHPVHIHPQVR